MKYRLRDLKRFLSICTTLAIAGSLSQVCANPLVQNDKAFKLPRLIASIKNFNGGVLVFSHNSTMLANGVPGKIQIWDARTWKLLRILRDPRIRPPFAFSPSGKTITLSLPDHRTQVWDVRTAKPLRTLLGFRTRVVFSPDGSLIAGWSVNRGQRDENTKIWDARTGQQLLSLKNGANSDGQYLFTPDNKRLLIADVSNFIKIYDVGSGKLISDADAFGDISPPIVLSPDGKTFATLKMGDVVGDDPMPGDTSRPATDAGLASAYTGSLWNARSGKLIRSFGYWETRDEPTAPLGFISDNKKVIYNVGEKLAYGGGPYAMIFDVATGQPLGTFDIVNPMLLSPDGKILVGGDKTLKVWAIPD